MPKVVMPGICVEDISLMPPSVADVETAVPGFIGYTERADLAKAGDLLWIPRRIRSLQEFEAIYGKGPRCMVREVRLDSGGNFVGAELAAGYLLYNSLRLFFDNGGGDCFIIAVGTYQAMPSVEAGALRKGLDAAAGVDDLTILLFPDAVLLGADELGLLQQAALKQCAEKQDRVAVLDTRQDDSLGVGLRDRIGITDLKYGAAYTPWLKTSYQQAVGYADVRNILRQNGAAVSFENLAADQVVLDTLSALDTAIATGTVADVARLEESLFKIFAAYRNVIQGVNDLPTVCPPSGAIAGVYAQVDRQRGVWKAPANISLSSVIGPAATFSASQLQDLTVDTAGKSINPIRFFPGKGTLVWGARTLAGNDNEWRYISVRRFFNLLEESIRKSTAWVVFEPNDANTWIKVVAMIENYLTVKWRDGALQGAKPEHAFYVKCGLGATMTALDIKEGRMIVEMGVAVVRPAEFIILKFRHKMQTQ